MITPVQDRRRKLPMISPTLEINERVNKLQHEGVDILHLAFGEAGLPVPEILCEALRAAVSQNSYGSVAGSAELRDSVAGYFSRRQLPTSADQIAIGPGSKALLYGLLLAIDGDVVIPRPSWVTYAPQVSLVGRVPIPVDIPRSCGGVPDPDILADQILEARRRGLSPKAVIITQPDNPTGTLASAEVLQQLAAIAREHNLWIISDEIYRDLTHNPSDYVSMAAIAGENTVVTSGLSKSLALGGWRLGVLRVPDNTAGDVLRRDVIGIASEIWSCVAAPVAAAAQIAFEEPSEIRSYVQAARHLHARVSAAIFHVFLEAGVSCMRPTACFYMYPDLEQARRFFHSKGIYTDSAASRYLLDEQHIAILPGSAFGDTATDFRFRVATSLLYGTSNEERAAAMDWAVSGRCDVPSQISAAQERLRIMLTAVIGA